MLRCVANIVPNSGPLLYLKSKSHVAHLDNELRMWVLQLLLDEGYRSVAEGLVGTGLLTRPL